MVMPSGTTIPNTFTTSPRGRKRRRYGRKVPGTVRKRPRRFRSTT